MSGNGRDLADSLFHRTGGIHAPFIDCRTCLTGIYATTPDTDDVVTPIVNARQKGTNVNDDSGVPLAGAPRGFFDDEHAPKQPGELLNFTPVVGTYDAPLDRLIEIQHRMLDTIDKLVDRKQVVIIPGDGTVIHHIEH